MHPIVVAIHNSIPFYCFDEYGIVKKKLFGLKKEYNQMSSKTYLIVKRAGLLDNLFAYETSNDLPDAKEVLNRLLSFDKHKCADFSKSYQLLYNVGMDNFLNLVDR